MKGKKIRKPDKITAAIERVVGCSWSRHLALVTTGISPYILLLISFMARTIVLDWGYFNGLSLVVRSSVLHYDVFPIHNPWVGGGLDILANPQSRVFSPMVFLDIFFQPHYANLLSLVVLSIAGVYGFYRLLLHLNFSPIFSLLGSFLFIHGTYFSLHFSVGHIAFGAFQLSGLALYFILRIREVRFKMWYALLNAFFLLNGSVYTFIFTQVLLLSTLVFTYSRSDWASFIRSLVVQWKMVLLILLAFVCLIAPKYLPFYWVFGSGFPRDQGFLSLPVRVLAHAFFNPFQWYGLDISHFAIKNSFHEGGTYLGIAGLVAIVVASFSLKQRLFLWIVGLMLFFFWLGAGWLEWLNPWHLMQYIPLVNNAHIQSRLFVYVFMFFVVLLCYALKGLKNRWPAWTFYVLIIFLAVESVFVSVYPYLKVLKDNRLNYPSEIFNKMIVSTTIDETLPSSRPPAGSPYKGLGFDFLHYYNTNKGSLHTYEPFKKSGALTSKGGKNYRGEVYVVKPTGEGKAEMERYTPGEVHISYKLQSPSIIVINTNYLGGWKASPATGNVISHRGLLAFEPDQLSGNVVLSYRPGYMYYIVPLFFSGILLFVFLIYKIHVSSGHVRKRSV
jgi:hypothetical protein